MSSFAKTGVTVVALVMISIAASPVSYAQSWPLASVLQLDSGGSYLGIEMSDVTSANMSKYKLTGEKGVIVRSVVKGAPAEKAGVRQDDVILEYAGTPVWSSAQFSRLVKETPAGRKVELAVSRDGKRMNLTAEIGSREENRAEEGWPNLFREYPSRGFDRRDVLIPSTPAGKPRLGLSLQPMSDQLAEHFGVEGKRGGALVSSVQEGSPSEGKIRAGDVIIAANGKEIRDPEDLMDLVRGKSEGKMTLKIIRDKKEITVEVTLPAAPASDERGKGLRL